MTKKPPKIPLELQQELLNKPLTCLEGVSLSDLSMNEGLDLIAKITIEINDYLRTSSIAKNLAKQIAHRNKKSANLSIPLDLEIGVSFDTDVTQTLPKKKNTPKIPKKMKQAPPETTLTLETEDSELDSLLEEAKSKKVLLKGVPKTASAIRKQIQKSDQEAGSMFELDLEEDEIYLDDIPIIEQLKPRKVKPLSITPKSREPSRLEKLAALAQSRGLDEIEQFASKKLGVENTDDSQDRF